MADSTGNPAEARGVELRESALSSGDLASSSTIFPPLRGVPRCTEKRRERFEPWGTTISDSCCASVLDSALWCLVRLSFRLSRRVFSPRTAPVLFKPLLGLAPVADSGTLCAWVLPKSDVCIVNSGGLGVVERCCWRSSSTQLAGVGGTGPRAVTPPGGGRLVGGEAIGGFIAFGRFRLWDRDCAEGGGPGGGGGSGIAGSHLVCEADLDRAEIGVSTALAEAALRALGGIIGARLSAGSIAGGILIINVCGRETEASERGPRLGTESV